MSYTSVLHCGNDHHEWISSLDFYDVDLDTLEGRLVEIVKKCKDPDAMAGVEHFQNQFIVQRNNIDELKHSINEHAHKVAADAQLHAGKIDGNLSDEHGLLQEQVAVFEKVMKELRHEYNLFVTKWI